MLDLLRAIHRGEVISEHRRHRWGFYRHNIGSVNALIERLEMKGAICLSTIGPGAKPDITIDGSAAADSSAMNHVRESAERAESVHD